MKDKRILIIIAFAAIVLGFLLFISRQTLDRSGDLKPESEIDSVRIIKEIRQAKDLIQAVVIMNASLNKKLNEKDRRLNKQKEKAENLQVKLKELSLENKRLDEELTWSKQEFKKQLAGFKKGLDSIETQIPRLIKKNKEYQNEAEVLEALIEQKETQIQDLTQELKQGLTKEKELKSAQLALEKELAKIQDKGSLLEKQLSESNLKIQNLEGQLNEGLAKQDELSQAQLALKKELAKIQDKSFFLEQQLNEKDAQIQNLEAELKQGLTKEKELKSAQITLVEKVNELQKKNVLLKEQLDQEQEQVVQLSKQIETQQDEHDRAVFSLEKSYQIIQERLRFNRAELEKLNSDYVSLKREYESTKVVIAGNEIELAKRADRILNLQDRLTIAGKNIEQFENDSLQQKEESTTLRRQYVARQLENETLRYQLNQYKRKLADLQTHIVQVSETNSLLQDRLQEISEIFTGAKAKKVNIELIPKTSSEVSDEQ